MVEADTSFTVIDYILFFIFGLTFIFVSVISIMGLLDWFNVNTPISNALSKEQYNSPNWYNYKRSFGYPFHWQRRRIHYGSYFPWYWNKDYTWNYQYRPIQINS